MTFAASCLLIEAHVGKYGQHTHEVHHGEDYHIAYCFQFCDHVPCIVAEDQHVKWCLTLHLC